MRKIQLDVLEALRGKYNFASGGTEVVVSDEGNMQVLLHGSSIVRIENNEQDIFVNLAGWNTVTTRGRINIVMDKYGISRVMPAHGAAEIAGRSIPSNGWVHVMHNGREIFAKVEK